MDKKQSAEQADPELGPENKTKRKMISTVGESLIIEMLLSFTLIVCFILLLVPSMVLGVAISIPFLLVTIVITRLVQTVRNGESTKQVKLLARNWLCLSVCNLLIVMGIFHWIATNVSVLRHGLLLGVPVLKWVKIVCIICGFHHLSYALLIGPRIMLPSSGNYAIPEEASEIIDCLIFWLAQHEVMKQVPAFKFHKLLGLVTQKWIACTLFILIGNNLIKLFTQFIVWLMRKWFVRNQFEPEFEERGSQLRALIKIVLPEKYLLYYANGMRNNVSFLLTALMLLLTWVFYFGPQLSGTNQARYVVGFGTSTCLSLLIFSFLCLLRDLVILSWEAHAIYIRMGTRILQAGEQLYFLGIISRHDCDIFRLLYNEEDYRYNTGSSVLPRKFLSALEAPNKDICGRSPYDTVDEWDVSREMSSFYGMKFARRKRDKLREDLLVRRDYYSTPAINEIQQVAKCFLVTRDALSKDMHISLILENLKTVQNPSTKNECTSFKENLRRLFVGENTSGTSDEQDSPNSRETNKRLVDFDALLKHASFSGELSSQEFQSWMERSRVNCILTGNILSNAKEAVECLNQIMSWLIVGGTLILWLILTGVATTKVIVLIASPLLAATFIFGDTCKSFFQGIMFVYVVHPFDVGDLCAIDEKMMEVKSIGVWKTIFSNVDKVGGQEEVIILNSELAHKTVINHKSEFDCNDYVEFILESHDNEKIEKLISQIEEYLNREDNRFTTSSHSVAVLTIENNMKIAVCFEHDKP